MQFYAFPESKKLAGSIKVTNTKWHANQISIDTSTDIWTIENHGLVSGDIVLMKTLNGDLTSVPNGSISVVNKMYVINNTVNTFQLSATSGGSAINFTSAGTNDFWHLEKPTVSELTISGLYLEKCIVRLTNAGQSGGLEPRINGNRPVSQNGALSASNGANSFDLFGYINTGSNSINFVGGMFSYYQNSPTNRWMTIYNSNVGWYHYEPLGEIITSVGFIIQASAKGFLDGTTLEIYEF